MNRKFKIGLFWLLMIGAVAGAAYGYHETYGLKDNAAKHLTPVVIGYQKADLSTFRANMAFWPKR